MFYSLALRLLMRLSVRKLAAAWEASLDRPRETQAARLNEILARNAGCEAGREYGFAGLDDADAYRRTLPIVTYEDLVPAIERMKAGTPNVLTADPVEMFAVTSGTTGRPKFVPVTRPMNLAQHRSHRLWMSRLVRDHPGVTRGALLSIVSPAEEGRTAGGIPYGSASGKNYINQPVPVRRLHALPRAAIGVADYDARHYCLLAFALAQGLSCVTSVNPSTLCLLTARLREWSEPLLEDLERSVYETRRGSLRNCPNLAPEERHALELALAPRKQRARDLQDILKRDGVFTPPAVWPRRPVICTWHGGNAPFYLARLEEEWGRPATRCLGLRASEGMFSIPLSDRTPEGVLATGGHFLEFVPAGVEVGPATETLLAHELEAGARYRLVITTGAGLYRYDLGDVVEVTGRRGRTPVVAFLHKAGNVLSITGEKVTEEQAVSALRVLQHQESLTGFTVTLRLGETPQYLLAAEVPDPAAWNEDRRAALAAGFDRELCHENIEYKAKRESRRLAPPVVELLPPGTYAAWRRRQVAGGRPDGQIKPPHLVAGEAALDAIRRAGAEAP
jgi:hypothetical protein